MKLQELKLGDRLNAEKVIIDHSSKRRCLYCDCNIWSGVLKKEETKVELELISLATWDIHKCKEKIK